MKKIEMDLKRSQQLQKKIIEYKIEEHIKEIFNNKYLYNVEAILETLDKNYGVDLYVLAKNEEEALSIAKDKARLELIEEFIEEDIENWDWTDITYIVVGKILKLSDFFDLEYWKNSTPYSNENSVLTIEKYAKIIKKIEKEINDEYDPNQLYFNFQVNNDIVDKKE